MKLWIEAECCKCQSRNFVDTGDPGDMTQFDPVGFFCWNCAGNNEFNWDGLTVESGDEQFDEGVQSP